MKVRFDGVAGEIVELGCWQMPSFGGAGIAGVVSAGQTGNVTTVAPVATVAPPPPPPPPPPPAPVALPPIGALGDYGGSPIGDVPAPSSGAFGFGTIAAGGVDSWFRSIARGAGGALGELGGIAVGQLLSENPRVAILTGEVGKYLGKSLADEFVDSFSDVTPTLLNPQPTTLPVSPGTLPVTPYQPGQIAPLIDRNCPACAGDLETLEGQRGELEKEIQTEQAQQRGQLEQQTQRQLQRYQDLEKQPASQRNIPQELQEKQNILEQLNQQIADLQNQVQPRQPQPYETTNPSQACPPGYHQCGPDIECETYGRCAPNGNAYQGYDSQPGQTPLINKNPPVQVEPVPQNQPQQPLFQQKEPPPGGLPSPAGSVTFCVSCTNQNEALKFLNGEPSECSVMPQGTEE